MFSLFYRHFLFLYEGRCAVFIGFSLLIMITTQTGCVEQVVEAPVSRQISPLINETNITPPSSECMNNSQSTVNPEHITLTNLDMNNQGKEITIKPGSEIQATLNYDYHCADCEDNLGHQIIVGLAKRSAQACIYNGSSHGQGVANFVLKAPAKPGKYEVRFRAVQAIDCDEALKSPWDADNSPTKETTIGIIVASKKVKDTEVN